MQTIFLGSDHAGFKLKQDLKKFLTKNGWQVADLSPVLVKGDDYPPIAKLVARRTADRRDGRAILVCGSGYGMDIAANRIRGARAIVARTVEDARVSRHDDGSNILVLGSRVTGAALARRIVSAWLTAPVGKAERFARRIKEIDET